MKICILRVINRWENYFNYKSVSVEGLVLVFFNGEYLTFLGHLGPLWVGELVLPHPDPLLHPWRDGLACVGVKWREATQPTETKETFQKHSHALI